MTDLGALLTRHGRERAGFGWARGDADVVVERSLAVVGSFLIHNSINDKQPCSGICKRTMRFGAVGDLITHAGRKREGSAVFQLRV